MSAPIIPFPAARVFRSQELIEALEKTAMCEAYLVSGDPLKTGLGEIMLPFWEGEIVRLGGVPISALVRDDSEGRGA